MFGIGFGEILIIILVTFLLSPKDIPNVIRKISQLFAQIDKIKKNLSDAGEDLNKMINDEKKDITEQIKKNDKE